MKKLILCGLVTSMTMLWSACDDDHDMGRGGEGSFNPIVALDVKPLNSNTSDVKSRAENITVADLGLRLLNDAGKAVGSWASVADFDATATFPTGRYTLEASHGRRDDEGFDKPYYFGSTAFTMAESTTTPVALTATLANAMVSVTTTEAYNSYFSSSTVDLATSLGNTLRFVDSETRAAYVAPGSINIAANVTRPDGTTATYRAAAFAAEARHHYHVTLDVNGGNVGSGTLSITFDDSVATQETTIDLSDEFTLTSAPSVGATGFNSGDIISVVEGSEYNSPLRFVVSAPGGLSSVKLETVSASLAARNWPATVELVNASLENQALLASLGLTQMGLWRNPDRMAIVDLAAVLANLSHVAGADNLTTFRLTVTDRLSRQSTPVELNVNLGALNLELLNAGRMFEEQEDLDFDMNFNGASPQSTVKLQYLNQVGTYSDLKVLSMEKTGENLYRVRVEGFKSPNDATSVTLRAQAYSLSGKLIATSPAFVVNRIIAQFALACNPGDIYANHGALRLTSSNDPVEEVANGGVLEMSTDGGESYKRYVYSLQGTMLKIAGLIPGTKYIARMQYKEVPSRRITFSTEDAAQLPNAGMEDWVTNGSGSNWECYYASPSRDASLWGTNNPMTTSQGADLGYCRISGSVPSSDANSGFTSDAHSGNNAAVIRTIGWGSGNSAAFGVGGNCKYIDAGLLHLGANRYERPTTHAGKVTGSVTTDDLVCGIPFASRPVQMSFWYKYVAKNSADSGSALVWLKDAAGNKLFETVIALPSQSTYKEIVIPINYTNTETKVASIYVRFLSTSTESTLVKDSKYLDGPGFGNLSRGTYMGSKLLIDDIQLQY